jgi:hypothetical protein
MCPQWELDLGIHIYRAYSNCGIEAVGTRRIV